MRPLTDVLVDLAAARGASLDFVRGENTAALRDEFGGIAGLTRFWDGLNPPRPGPPEIRVRPVL